MILGVQRWLCLFPNHFEDEPSDADRHKQDRDRVVPIRTGVGARLGVNVGYLKFTPEPTWNPF